MTFTPAGMTAAASERVKIATTVMTDMLAGSSARILDTRAFQSKTRGDAERLLR